MSEFYKISDERGIQDARPAAVFCEIKLMLTPTADGLHRSSGEAP